MNLFEMFANAQNGNAMTQMARQFGISQDQVETAMAALMPAFSTAFKRNAASDPLGMGNFMQALATGGHAKYFEDMSRAFQPQGIEEGNGILGHLFGSKEVSRAIAAQAAQATGMGQEIFKQMLPVIASTLMGGMFKQATGQMQAASAAQGNVIGQVIEQMMRQGGMATSQPQQSAPRNPNPMDNPFGKALEQIFGNGQQVAPDDPEDDGRIPNPMNPANNPWGKMFEEMMRGGQAQEASEPARAPDPQPRQKYPYEDIFGEMFDSGRKSQEKFQDQYQRSIEQVFDQYMDGMNRLGGRR